MYSVHQFMTKNHLPYVWRKPHNALIFSFLVFFFIKCIFYRDFTVVVSRPAVGARKYDVSLRATAAVIVRVNTPRRFGFRVRRQHLQPPVSGYMCVSSSGFGIEEKIRLNRKPCRNGDFATINLRGKNGVANGNLRAGTRRRILACSNTFDFHF